MPLGTARELTLYFVAGSTTQIDYGIPGAQRFIDDGWVITATDYQGIGTPGPHQYTVNRTNGLDALYIVHAAREMNVGAGTQVGMIGWSQGGGSVAPARRSARGAGRPRCRLPRETLAG